jgi:hypothetical protein
MLWKKWLMMVITELISCGPRFLQGRQLTCTENREEGGGYPYLSDPSAIWSLPGTVS